MLGCQGACQVIDSSADVCCRFTGVSWRGQLWRAAIRVSQSMIFLGYWGTEEQAAQAYDQAAIAYGVRSQAWAQLSLSAKALPDLMSLLDTVPGIGKRFGCIKTQSEEDHMQGIRTLNFPADHTPEDLQAEGGDAVRMR